MFRLSLVQIDLESELKWKTWIFGSCSQKILVVLTKSQAITGAWKLSSVPATFFQHTELRTRPGIRESFKFVSTYYANCAVGMDFSNTQKKGSITGNMKLLVLGSFFIKKYDTDCKNTCFHYSCTSLVRWILRESLPNSCLKAICHLNAFVLFVHVFLFLMMT